MIFQSKHTAVLNPRWIIHKNGASHLSILSYCFFFYITNMSFPCVFQKSKIMLLLYPFFTRLILFYQFDIWLTRSRSIFRDYTSQISIFIKYIYKCSIVANKLKIHEVHLYFEIKLNEFNQLQQLYKMYSIFFVIEWSLVLNTGRVQ